MWIIVIIRVHLHFPVINFASHAFTETRQACVRIYWKQCLVNILIVLNNDCAWEAPRVNFRSALFTPSYFRLAITRWTPRPLRRRSWRRPTRHPRRALRTKSQISVMSPCPTALRPSPSGPSAATGDVPWAQGSTSGPGSARLLARGKYPSRRRG